MAAVELSATAFPGQVRRKCNATPNTWREVQIQEGTTDFLVRNAKASTANLIYSLKQDLEDGDPVAGDLEDDEAEELGVGEYYNSPVFPGQLTAKTAITKFFVASTVAESPFVVSWTQQQLGR